MRKIFWILLLAAALTNMGCVVPSLHPLFNDQELVFDPQMIGAWTDDDDSLWVFDKTSNGAYLLTVADTHELSMFDAHLLELDSHRFLDLYPRTESDEDSFRGLHLLPVHTFYKVRFEGETLLLIPMSQDWLEESIKSGVIEIPHAWNDGELLLTASTEELQKMVLLFAEDPEAFPVDPSEDWMIELEPTTL